VQECSSEASAVPHAVGPQPQRQITVTFGGHLQGQSGIWFQLTISKCTELAEQLPYCCMSTSGHCKLQPNRLAENEVTIKQAVGIGMMEHCLEGLLPPHKEERAYNIIIVPA